MDEYVFFLLFFFLFFFFFLLDLSLLALLLKRVPDEHIWLNVIKIILYRGVNKGLYVLLSRIQAGPGRTVKQEQEDISRNHVQTFISPSVDMLSSQQVDR